MCTQPAASVFADVYVGVKTHLCNLHTCPCTSAQNTCSKVHATLTAKKCTYICTYTHMHTHTYAHEHTCACMTPSTRWSTDTETHNLCRNMHTGEVHGQGYPQILTNVHSGPWQYFGGTSTHQSLPLDETASKYWVTLGPNFFCQKWTQYFRRSTGQLEPYSNPLTQLTVTLRPTLL